MTAPGHNRCLNLIIFGRLLSDVEYVGQRSLYGLVLVDVAQPHEWCVHVAQSEAQLLVEIVAASCFYIVEQLIHPAGWQWIFIGVIILDLSQLGSLGYSIVQSAQAVDQLDVLGIRTEPNSSLRYLLHLVDRHLSAVCGKACSRG